MAKWESYLEKNRQRFLNELLEFLSIPSISALPEHADDVQRAAEWVSRRLKGAGFENTRVMATGGHPVVYADWLHAAGQPTVMIYGHFDVQPIDPIELWASPPFEPAVRHERVYARGASDNKGNMFAAICAIEAMLKADEALPVNVKFFFEGQEEIGSPQIPDFLDKNRTQFACDMVISADGGQWSEEQPELSLGCRGICGLQIDVKGPETDLHSGQFGGAVLNPIHALVQLLNSMHDSDCKITVPGFYDDILPLSRDERARIAAVPFNESAYKKSVGVSTLFGEKGYTPLERLWVRPTLEVNGIWGGFQGEGSKTVLPSEAHAKITCRLVPDQRPERILRLIASHVERHASPGVKATVHLSDHGSRAYVVPANHPGNQAVSAVLKELYGKEPFRTRMGGTVPVCDMFLRRLNSYSVFLAFSLDDEMVHAPNEFFRISSFRRAQRAYCMLMGMLAKK